MKPHHTIPTAAPIDPILNEWIEQVQDAYEQRTPLSLQGAGSKTFYGHKTAGDPMVLTAYQGVVDYEPSELVITVKAGTTVAEIEALLAEQQQFLAFEPPIYAPDSTIAGCVAAGLAGPRRAQAGGVRDFILGVKIIDGQGRLMTFGGQVMKNVAGYDVSRLMAGSLGTLGILAELSIKVLPLPPQEKTLVLTLDARQALEKLNRWGAQPLPISGSLWCAGQLYLRLSGAPSALSVAQQVIGGEPLAPSQANELWQGLRHQEHAWFQSAVEKVAADPSYVLWRLSLPSTAPYGLEEEAQLIEWGGALRWCLSALPAEHIRAAAAELGGTATAFRSQQAELAVFHSLAPAVLSIQQRLKQKFDPAGIFNPGKIYPGEL